MNTTENKKSKKVFLITKLKTTNLGNQALTMELIKIFEEKIGKENLHVAGRPLGLVGYNEKALLASSNPEELFDKWADAIIRKYKKLSKGGAFRAKVGSFSLDEIKGAAIKVHRLKAIFRPMVRFIRKSSLFNKSYLNRLDVINNSDYVVYSGAGEIGDYHIFLRQLLELRIAQKLGKKTGGINQSLTVRSDVYKRIVKHVYGKMDHVVVRGNISKEELVKIGVEAQKVSVFPDTAILTKPKGQRPPSTNTVGLNLTRDVSFDWEDAEIVVKKLREKNKKIVYITNEPVGDSPISEGFNTRFGIPSLTASESYLDYAQKLSQFDFVISTRLHTNVMSLSAGTPVIPIEGKVFKTRELVDEFKYPVAAVNVNDKQWAAKVAESIDKVVENKIDFDTFFNNTLPDVRKRVYGNVNWIIN